MTGTRTKVEADALDDFVNQAEHEDRPTEQDLKVFTEKPETQERKPEVRDKEQGSQEDARLSDEHEDDRGSGNETDEQREQRRQDRKRRRERQRLARDAKDAEIEALKAQVREMGQVLGTVRQDQVSTAAAQLKAAEDKARREYQQAEIALTEAISNGNAAAHVKALADRDAAAEDFRKVQGQKERLAQYVRGQQHQARQQQTQQKPEAQGMVDARLARESARFMAKVPFYDPAKQDDESVLRVNELDNELAREGGLDPHTSAYWDELYKRVREEMPEKFAANGGRQQNGNGGSRRGPGVGGSGSGSSDPDVNTTLSSARIVALKQAGKWDDPKERAKMIASYKEYDKRQAASGR